MTVAAPLTADKVQYRFDGFLVDPARRLLLRDGEAVPVTPKALAGDLPAARRSLAARIAGEAAAWFRERGIAGGESLSLSVQAEALRGGLERARRDS